MTELSNEMNWPWLARLGETLAAVKWRRWKRNARRFVWRTRTRLAISVMSAANAVAMTIAPWIED
jgi:hypothetical protein